MYKVRFELDSKPFKRGGSVAIIVVALLHAYQAWLYLNWPFSGKATSMMEILYFFKGIGHIPADCVSSIMFLTSILAIIGTFFRLGWLRVAIFLPQHAILALQVIGCLVATYNNSYLDGTAMNWQHISSDQAIYVGVFIIHLSAIIRRCRDPNG